MSTGLVFILYGISRNDTNYKTQAGYFVKNYL